MDSWNRTECTEINQCPYGQLIYDKVGKNSTEKRQVSSINGAGKTGQLHIKG